MQDQDKTQTLKAKTVNVIFQDTA